MQPPATVSRRTMIWTMIVTSVAVACILIAAAQMAIRRKGQPAAVMAMGLTRLVIVSAAATFVVEAAGKLGDAFSADLMSSAHIGTAAWTDILDVSAISTELGINSPALILIIGLLVIFASLIQLMLMILRAGLLVILTGTLPLAAAASMSEWGESWWRRHVGWLAAWLLYKPAAALLFAGAFHLTQDKTSLTGVLSGFMLLIMSVLTLPALLRVIVPATASLGAASSGPLAMAAFGAAATGAIKIAGMAATGGASAAAMAGQKGAASAAAPSGATGPAGTQMAADGETPGNAPSPAAPQGQHAVSGTADQFSAERERGSRPAGAPSSIPGSGPAPAPRSATGTAAPASGSATAEGLPPASQDGGPILAAGTALGSAVPVGDHGTPPASPAHSTAPGTAGPSAPPRSTASGAVDPGGDTQANGAS